MAGYNRAIVCGNLGQDPEVKTFQNGGEVVNLSVATSETWKDKTTGEKKERVQWHRIVILNEGIAKIAKTYLKNGSQVLIEGQMETRKYEKNGADHYTTEIVLRPFHGELTLLGGREGGGRGQDEGTYDQGQAYGGQQSQGQAGGAPAGGARSDMDDEIPFSMEWRL